MNNFARVLRLALRYRWTFLASIFSALMVAVLWGANIGTIYPFVEVAFKNKSLQDWVDQQIAETQESVAQARTEIERLEAEAQQNRAGEDSGQWAAALRQAQFRLETEQAALARYRWLKPWIDDYLPRDPFTTLCWLTAVLLAGTLLKDAFVIGHNVLVARLAQSATFDLRNLFFRRTLRMDLASFDEAGTADLMSRFTHDTECVAAGLTALFGKLVREPLKMTACLIGAAVICWQLLLLSLLAAPLAAWLVRWLGRTLKRANRRAMEEMAQLYGVLEETFRGIKIIKAFTSEARQRRRFHRSSRRFFQKAMKIAAYDSLAHPMSEMLGMLAISMSLLAGAYLVLKGQTHLFGVRMCARPLSLSSLLLFYGLLAGVADPLRKLSDVFSRLQRAVAASDRICASLDRKPRVREPRRPVSFSRHKEEIRFEQVSFAYRPDQPVLKQIDLCIPFGRTVAVVGPNGCGKSTLLSLIPRFYDPSSGQVLLDRVPLGQIRLRDLRRQIGLVTQETLLFDTTVFENIRYGNPHASREDVIRAAQQAHAHRFIVEQLPDGYETMVGSLGGRLSGGQRQRIALARVILRDPAIVLLDEATSQIDLESEQAIRKALEEFIEGRTVVLVTHRPAILALADQIVVLQDGRIADQGSHQELLERCGLYQRLYQAQFTLPASGPDVAAA